MIGVTLIIQQVQVLLAIMVIMVITDMALIALLVLPMTMIGVIVGIMVDPAKSSAPRPSGCQLPLRVTSGTQRASLPRPSAGPGRLRPVSERRPLVPLASVFSEGGGERVRQCCRNLGLAARERRRDGASQGVALELVGTYYTQTS